MAITYTNGTNVTFYAQEFDVDLIPESLSGVANRYALVQKLTYKNPEGEDALVYLKPEEVAGIVTTYTDGYNLGLSVS